MLLFATLPKVLHNFLSMEGSFDIVQLPKHLRQEDLPDRLEVDQPFEIGGVKYVLSKEGRSDLRVCSRVDSSQNTTVPQSCGSYYMIRRV